MKAKHTTLRGELFAVGSVFFRELILTLIFFCSFIRHSNSAVLSEVGTLQVEFRYLAKITGRMEYATEAMRALDELLKLDTQDGLYPTLIQNIQVKPSFANDEISIGAMGDSFYEYLLKIWLQGGKEETKYRRAYDKAMKGIMDKLIHISRPNYLTYVAELKYGKIIHKMDHLACFLGGNLALGAYTVSHEHMSIPVLLLRPY